MGQIKLPKWAKFSCQRQIWDEERRVCLSKHFDTYFRMSLSEETISRAELNDLIARADDKTFVQGRMRQARDQIRKDGKSMVPVILDELTAHAREIRPEKVQSFLCALFAIVDDIRRQEDGERGLVTVTTHLRIHWLIRRVTEDRFSIEEKTSLYLAATEKASMGWLIDFVASAVGQHQPKDGRAVDVLACLVDEEVIPVLKDRAVASIRQAAKNGSLLHADDLMYNIYRWRELSNDKGAEVREWLSKIMKDDAALVILARSLTGESWSTGLGGFGSLGDRVSRRSVRVKIADEFDLFDTSRFKTELERVVAERHHSEHDMKAVETFLAAWANNREARND